LLFNLCCLWWFFNI